jgi:hypothetical protein
VRSARRYLAALLADRVDERRHLIELGVVLALIALIAIFALVFLGDAIAELITFIGGSVDEQTSRQWPLPPTSSPLAP